MDARSATPPPGGLIRRLRAMLGGSSGDSDASVTRRLAGAIAGKALYERRFTVAEGIQACSAGGFDRP